MSTNMTPQQVSDVARRALLMFSETLEKAETQEKKIKSLEEELDITITDKKTAISELESANNRIELLEAEKEGKEAEDGIDGDISINCQSGGSLLIDYDKTNMRVNDILDGLKSYLESGRNEQALVDFLNN